MHQPMKIKDNYLSLYGGDCKNVPSKEKIVLIIFQCGTHLVSCHELASSVVERGSILVNYIYGWEIYLGELLTKAVFESKNDWFCGNGFICHLNFLSNRLGVLKKICVFCAIDGENIIMLTARSIIFENA